MRVSVVVCLRQIENEKSNLFMWLAGAYFDESTDDFADDTFTVAGFVGSGLAALNLDLQWKELLKKFKISYFKASELEYGFGEFRRYRDDPSSIKKGLSDTEKSKIREIKTEFIDLICDHSDMRGIGCCMLLRDLAALRSEFPELADRLPAPYVLCSELMLIEAGIMVNATNRESPKNTGVLRPIFDSHEVYEPIIRGDFETFCFHNPESSSCLLPPIFESEKDYRCLQAADCLAFEARKLLHNTHYDPYRPERIAMTKLKETSIDVLYKLDHGALKLIATDYTVPINELVAPMINNRPTRARKVAAALSR